MLIIKNFCVLTCLVLNFLTFVGTTITVRDIVDEFMSHLIRTSILLNIKLAKMFIFVYTDMVE